MEFELAAAIGILSFLCIIVAIDEMLENKLELGEEWDFTRINFIPRPIDIHK